MIADWELDAGTVARYSIALAMYIMFLEVTHQHSDKKWVPQSRSPKNFFAGLPPRTPPKSENGGSGWHFANPPLTRALASWVWSLSFLHLLLLFLLLLFLNALAFIFSVTRSFRLPEFSFFI